MTDNKKPGDARFPYKKQFDDLPSVMDELVDHMNGIQGEIECVRNCNPEVCLISYFVDHKIKIKNCFRSSLNMKI